MKDNSIGSIGLKPLMITFSLVSSVTGIYSGVGRRHFNLLNFLLVLILQLLTRAAKLYNTVDIRIWKINRINVLPQFHPKVGVICINIVSVYDIIP